MPRFPEKETDIIALAEPLWRGLLSNRLVYPKPPIHPILVRMRALVYRNRRDIMLARQAKAESTITAENEALEDLIEALKSNIRYAENTVNYDDDKLKLIGWAGRQAATALTPPGQSRLLEAPKQSEGWVFLDWKAPADGGVPAAYKVMRREQTEGAWSEVATAVVSEATLVDQPRGKELEYRIIAVNKSGEGEPSNTAMVVL